ncbi:hypothetical protein TRICI_001733 [Trichomonascus ciferrii]|uniref:Uncharacterized protein n=1 Tax=Trichomonascus ciferrii TaxID=44093 RepID=A0A642V7L4_9ASCO|nr:hypothetical protein TRICI_001733 [Trichomonascus ciferrii]
MLGTEDRFAFFLRWGGALTVMEYQEFEQFDFEGDEAFQRGLQTILQNDAIHEHDFETVKLNAQIFYYNKQRGTDLTLEGYRTWKNEPQSEDSKKPKSYNDIVELILSGKPIPGIMDIPNTTLGEEASSESKAPERKKPWEK